LGLLESSPALSLQNPLAALIECCTFALHHPLQHALHFVNLLDPFFELAQLGFAQRMPPLRDWWTVGKIGKQDLHFLDRKPQLPGALDDRQPAYGGLIVEPLSAAPIGRGEHADLLIVSQCGGP
jgi:hypothetical protein